MKTIREIFADSRVPEDEIIAELEARERQRDAEIAKAVDALDGYLDQIETAIADGNASEAMVEMLLANDVMVWLKARVRSEGQS